MVREAIRRQGTAARLAEALEGAGIRPKAGRYSHQNISKWAKGTSMPPAVALLAAAQLTGLSIDEQIHGHSIQERLDRMEMALGELRRLVEARPLLARAEVPPDIR